MNIDNRSEEQKNGELPIEFELTLLRIGIAELKGKQARLTNRETNYFTTMYRTLSGHFGADWIPEEWYDE